MTTPRLEDSVRVASSFAGQQQADPWDAPYFGGPVFLAYAPTKLADASSDLSPVVATPPPTHLTDEKVPPTSRETATSASTYAVGVTLIDVPYFGGPISGIYPSFPVPVPGFSPATDSSPQNDSPKVLAATAISPVPVALAEPAPSPTPDQPERRRGLFARIFGTR